MVIAGLIDLFLASRQHLTGLGMILAAAPPLAYLVANGTGPRHPEAPRHPVGISVLSGLGCVLAMVAVYRFGDDFRYGVMACLVAISLWLVYVRFYR